MFWFDDKIKKTFKLCLHFSFQKHGTTSKILRPAKLDAEVSILIAFKSI